MFFSVVCFTSPQYLLNRPTTFATYLTSAYFLILIVSRLQMTAYPFSRCGKKIPSGKHSEFSQKSLKNIKSFLIPSLSLPWEQLRIFPDFLGQLKALRGKVSKGILVYHKYSKFSLLYPRIFIQQLLGCYYILDYAEYNPYVKTL